jgi:hypothetical protein
MLKYVYDELTNSFYLVEDDELPYLIAEKLKQLSEDELKELLGEDTLSKFRKRFD